MNEFSCDLKLKSKAMKKTLLQSCFLFIAVNLMSQSGFDPQAFLDYKESIRNMTASELLAKYPAQTVYYSNRSTPTDLDMFQYLDSIELKFGLTKDEKDMLADNHFMVTERLSSWSFADAIVNIYSSDLPFFLSTDLVLHALHASYDKMLQNLEYELLQNNLESMIDAMRDEIDHLYSVNSTNPFIKQSVEDADLFLAVGLSLLKGTTVKPLYDNSGNYEILMTEIMKENPGLIVLSLFSDHTRKFDASQFTPRGHYTEEFWTPDGQKNLKNYFRSMMWFGRAEFYLTPPPVGPGEAEWSDEDILRMNTSALIVNELLLRSGKTESLELHEKIIGFFVGPEDNLSPLELSEIVNSLEIEYSDIQNNSVFELLQEKICSSDDYGQKILSNFFIVDSDTENPADLPVSYRLLGQKFLIDSYVFSQVVYDNIYYKGNEVFRMMPDPLDIMFVLGNEDALPLLKDELDNYHYAYKLEELRYLTDAYDDDFWNQSLYNNWLDAIRALNPLSDKSGYPYFMKTTEWQIQKLNTQLSSWAELRHDNVLYAKQSYTGGTSCSFPHVYIEPYPEFYNLLNRFSENAYAFFNEELNYLNLEMKDKLLEYYSKFGDHMLKLKTLSEKELRMEKFNSGDITYLKTFVNSAMASGPYISGWYPDLFYDELKAFEPDYLVVDVHTQPTEPEGAVVGRVMHVGTGHVNYGIFCAGTAFGNYEATAFIGPVMSFHRKDTTNWVRLTDEQWSEFFYDNRQVDRPDWVYHYLLDKYGNKKETTAPNLNGISYTANNTEEFTGSNTVSYLLAFPNPTTGKTSLRFVLNHSSDIIVEIYDGLGRSVYSENLPGLAAGEIEIPINLEGLANGLYYIKMQSDSDRSLAKIIIR